MWVPLFVGVVGSLARATPGTPDYQIRYDGLLATGAGFAAFDGAGVLRYVRADRESGALLTWLPSRGWETVPLPSPITGVVHLAVGQIDGQLARIAVSAQAGDEDLLAEYVVDSEGGLVEVWSAAGQGMLPTYAGDIDGDQVEDLLLGNELLLSSSGARALLPAMDRERGMGRAHALGDLTGDGYADLLLQFTDTVDDGILPYGRIVAHLALFEGSPDGLGAVPLWTLGVEDMTLDPRFAVGSQVAQIGSDILVVSAVDETVPCFGEAFAIVLHGVSTATPEISQQLQVKAGADYCGPVAFTNDTTATEAILVVHDELYGFSWYAFDGVSDQMADIPIATWAPDFGTGALWSDWIVGGEQLAWTWPADETETLVWVSDSAGWATQHKPNATPPGCACDNPAGQAPITLALPLLVLLRRRPTKRAGRPATCLV